MDFHLFCRHLNVFFCTYLHGIELFFIFILNPDGLRLVVSTSVHIYEISQTNYLGPYCYVMCLNATFNGAMTGYVLRRRCSLESNKIFLEFVSSMV